MKEKAKPILCPIITVMSAALLFTSCVLINIGDSTSRNSIQAKGEREIYQINTGVFSKIKIEGISEVRYYAGSSDTVTLEVPSNVREYHEVLVENGELIIRTKNRISYGRNNSPILTVYAPSLELVTFEGAGSFTAYDKITADKLSLITLGAGSAKAEIDVNNLTANIAGAGSFNLSGKAQTASISISGAGDVDALSLQTIDAAVIMSGTGTVKVNCTGKLDITAGGAGTIEYKGSPNVSLNTSGLVSIRQIK